MTDPRLMDLDPDEVRLGDAFACHFHQQFAVAETDFHDAGGFPAENRRRGRAVPARIGDAEIRPEVRSMRFFLSGRQPTGAADEAADSSKGELGFVKWRGTYRMQCTPLLKRRTLRILMTCSICSDPIYLDTCGQQGLVSRGRHGRREQYQ